MLILQWDVSVLARQTVRTHPYTQIKPDEWITDCLLNSSEWGPQTETAGLAIFCLCHIFGILWFKAISDQLAKQHERAVCSSLTTGYRISWCWKSRFFIQFPHPAIFELPVYSVTQGRFSLQCIHDLKAFAVHFACLHTVETYEKLTCWMVRRRV